MKSQTLPVKRRLASHGILRRLSAVTRNRKQRVAATASAVDMESDDASSKISRVLIILFLIHIVAIGMIFIHQQFLKGRKVVGAELVKTVTAEAAPAVLAKPQHTDLPCTLPGEKPYCVQAGDNYARIAAKKSVDETALRSINKHVNITPGLLLKIPPQTVVAKESPEVAITRDPSTRDREPEPKAVETISAREKDPPRAIPVRSNGTRPVSAKVSSDVKGGAQKMVVVQAGDSIWRIANRCKVSQDALMQANGISDSRKLKTGMKLVIPQS